MASKWTSQPAGSSRGPEPTVSDASRVRHRSSSRRISHTQRAAEPFPYVGKSGAQHPSDMAKASMTSVPNTSRGPLCIGQGYSVPDRVGPCRPVVGPCWTALGWAQAYWLTSSPDLCVAVPASMVPKGHPASCQCRCQPCL